jgi:hypothetical protein
MVIGLAYLIFVCWVPEFGMFSEWEVKNEKKLNLQKSATGEQKAVL